MYGRMYLLRGPVSQSQVRLPCESILRCSIARLAYFNARAMNQARTQIFEDGVCVYVCVWRGGGGES